MTARSSHEAIQAMFMRVRRDSPKMDGVRAVLFTAEMLSIHPLEVWLAVDGRFIFYQLGEAT